MANTTIDQTIIEAINKAYQIDVQAIRNLSEVATKLQDGGLTIAGDLTITGKIKMGSAWTIDPDTVNKLVPVGTIVSYNSVNPPTGWALCDGTPPTPDLRGRFILGSGNGVGLTSRTLLEKGGFESITMTSTMVAPHNHRISAVDDKDVDITNRNGYLMNQGAKGVTLSSAVPTVGSGIWVYSSMGYGGQQLTDSLNLYASANTLTTGDGSKAKPFAPVQQTPINIIPPFYVLTYIIKL
jgi:microcystin-dependent protein